MTTENPENTSYIHISCSPKDKAKWVRAAQNQKINLASWMTKTLNEAVEKDPQINKK